jgi:hypothetical protein
MVGGREVFGAGTLIVHTGDDVAFYPFPGSDYKVSIEFRFVDPGSTTVINTEIISDSHVKLVIFDVIDGDWLSGANPIEIATDRGQKIFVSLASLVLGTKEDYAIILHHSFLRGGG